MEAHSEADRNMSSGGEGDSLTPKVRGQRGQKIGMKQLVVLDKSFVRDASAVRIAEICETYRAMMIQDLAFELIKDDQETRVEYFRKFPQRSTPFELIENVGSLLRYEIEYRRPCTPSGSIA